MKPIIIRTEAQRQRAVDLLRGLPLEPAMRVSLAIAESVRNLEQNARMWAMLHDISRQVVWHGQKLRPEEWKDVFTAALKRLKVVPGLDGGFVVIGAHTSKMSIREMSEMIELMFAFGAEHKVVWTDPKLPQDE